MDNYENVLKYSDIDQTMGIVELLSVEDSLGNPNHMYVSFFPSKYTDFIEAQEKGLEMDITSYGDVLFQGAGAEPSADTVKEMESKYGVDHMFTQKLLAEVKRLSDEGLIN